MNKPKLYLFRRITKRFVIICNIILAIVFLLASLSFYANPVQYWYIAFLGLAFPYLLLLVILFFLLWIVFKSKWIFLNIAILIIGWQNVNAVFAFNLFPKKFSIEQKDSTAIRILHWNTLSFGEYDKDRVKGSESRDKMFEYIKTQEADILCLQEFFDSYNEEFSQNIAYITQKLGYPYYYYSKDYERYGITRDSGSKKIGYWGTIIFSKISIVDSGKVRFNADIDGNTESLSFIDVVKDNKKVRVMSTHLQSVKFGKLDYAEIDKIKSGTDTDIRKSKNIFSKIRKAYRYRKQQADIIKAEIAKIKTPYILTGDLNDVPNSYTYSTIKGKMQDVFLKKGFGIGRTFSSIAPTLRIDYIFASKDFKVIQQKKDNISLSDHYPIVCDVKLK